MTTRGRDTTSNEASNRRDRDGRPCAWTLLAVAAALLVVAVGIARLSSHGGSAGDPREAPVQLQVGMERRAQGDLRGAVQAFQRAAALLPGWPAAYLQLGITYYEAREYDLARKELERAAELAPDEAAVWGQLGKLHLTTGESTSAEAALQRAMQLEPDRTTYPALLGEVYRQRGDPASVEKAITLFRHALSLHPENAEAFHRLGLAYQRLGRLGEASVALAAATRFAPGQPEPYYALAQVERGLGREDSANRALRTFRRLERKRQAAEETRAAASTVASRSDQPQPLTAEAARFLMEGRHAFYEEGQPDRAIELFRLARQAAPRNPDVHYNLGLVLHFAGRLDESEESFRLAMALNPRNPRYHAWIGTLHLERSPVELDAAVAALRRSIELGPDYAYGHYQLGRAYLLQDRPAEAAPLLERTVSLNPRYREAYYSLGQSYLRLGEREKARRALAKFRQLDAVARERRRLSLLVRAAPDDPAPGLRLARFLAANGEKREALRVLERLTRAFPDHREVQNELERLRQR